MSSVELSEDEESQPTKRQIEILSLVQLSQMMKLIHGNQRTSVPYI